MCLFPARVQKNMLNKQTLLEIFTSTWTKRNGYINKTCVVVGLIKKCQTTKSLFYAWKAMKNTGINTYLKPSVALIFIAKLFFTLMEI